MDGFEIEQRTFFLLHHLCGWYVDGIWRIIFGFPFLSRENIQIPSRWMVSVVGMTRGEIIRRKAQVGNWMWSIGWEG
jgi:hypothetical protein